MERRKGATLSLHDCKELKRVAILSEQKTDNRVFYNMNAKGEPTTPIDNEIFIDIKNSEDIVIVGGVPYVYNGGVYRQDVSGAFVKTLITQRMIPEKIKSTDISRIYKLFFADAEIEKKPDEMNHYPVYWINFKNGMYDPVLKTMHEHAPDYYSTCQIPWAYNPNSDIVNGVEDGLLPAWYYNLFDSAETAEMVLEFFGLCMCRDTGQQKFLIMCGAPGTGKSTLISLICKMLGGDNVSSVALHQLHHRFSAYALMGKLANCCADIETGALQDASMIKKLMGEDSIAVEAKGKDIVSCSLFAKLIFSTNELPEIKGEASNGFYRRLLIAPMNREPKERRHNIGDDLKYEMIVFIAMCVKALERMYERRTIIESDESIAAVRRMRKDSDSVEAFIDDCCELTAAGRERRSDVFDRYMAYCYQAELQAQPKHRFFKSLRVKGFGEVKSYGIYYISGIKFCEV